jgi:hypothetical protein
MLEENATVASSVPAAAEHAGKIAEDRRVVRAKLYQSCFGTEVGRAVLADMKSVLDRQDSMLALNQKTGMADPMMTAYRIAQREWLMFIQDQIGIASEFSNLGKPKIVSEELSTFEMMQQLSAGGAT